MSFEIGQTIVETSDVTNLSLHLAPKFAPNPFALYKILLSTLNPIQLNENGKNKTKIVNNSTIWPPQNCWFGNAYDACIQHVLYNKILPKMVNITP